MKKNAPGVQRITNSLNFFKLDMSLMKMYDLFIPVCIVVLYMRFLGNFLIIIMWSTYIASHVSQVVGLIGEKKCSLHLVSAFLLVI